MLINPKRKKKSFSQKLNKTNSFNLHILAENIEILRITDFSSCATMF